MRFCPECSTRHPDAQEICPACGRTLVALNDDDNLIGQELDGRYLILELLGQGGMGQVYRARQRHVERDVAVKIIRRDLGQGEDLVKRFFREARMVAALKNPHIVTLHDFGVAREGLIYFTMELLDGILLSTLLKQHGRLPWRRALAIARQICEALEEAHGKDVIHRDLKPDNVYVQITGDRDLARVLDFGLAKSLEHGSHLTSRGMVVGTPEYMSPEQSTGVDLDHRSDLYSLGVLLYTLLTGAPPFTGGTPLQILHCHIREAPEPPQVRCPEAGIPGALDSLLVELLQKNPDLRPQDARSLARRMDRILGGAERASGPYVESEDLDTLRLQRLPRSARIWLAVLLSGALVAAALFFWVRWGDTQEETSGPAGADPRSQETEGERPMSEPEASRSYPDIVSREPPDLVGLQDVKAAHDSVDVPPDRSIEDEPATASAAAMPGPAPDAAVADVPSAETGQGDTAAEVTQADAVSERVVAEPPPVRSGRGKHPARVPAAENEAAEGIPSPEAPAGEEMFKLQEVRKEGGIFELKKVEPGDGAD